MKLQPRIVRILAALFGLGGGVAIAYYVIEPLLDVYPFFAPWVMIAAFVAVPLLTGLILYLSAPLLWKHIAQLVAWLEAKLTGVPLIEIMLGSAGLIVGLIIATLLGGNLARIPWFGSIAAIAVTLLFAYLGWQVAIKKREDILALLPSARLRDRRQRGQVSRPKLLDTSAIIDGRIADTYAVGFLEGPIVIPQFVLDELQRIADSTDPLKRQRGRRGLDVLSRLQKELGADVEILADDRTSGEVDARLVELAKQLRAKLLTTDFNLSKVAELQGIDVLNVNDLANALKPVLLPGEEITVQLIREGKEPGQGVGYLDDGTMIVVEAGRPYIGETVTVTVTSVLQTSAGRMIFTRLKPAAKRA